MTQDDRDRAVLVLSTALATFLVVAIVGISAVALTGNIDISEEWHQLMAIASGIAGLIGGYFGRGITDKRQDD